MKRRQRFEQNKSNIRKLDTGGSAPKRKKRRRSSGTRIALVVTVLLAAAVGTVLSLTVFFKIKSIDVYGESIYTSKQIISATAVELESNLIRVDGEFVAQRVEKALPYIEDVKIKKRLPSTLEINITAAKVAGYIAADDGYCIVSTEGKFLEKVSGKPENTAQITGVEIGNISVAENLADAENTIGYVKKIYSSLGNAMSRNITSVDVSDRINLSFVYRDRVTVRLGSESDLEEKLKFVVRILSDPEKISEDDVGIIYAGNAKKISFLRKGSYSELKQNEYEQADDVSQSELTSSQSPSSETEYTQSENSSQTEFGQALN